MAKVWNQAGDPSQDVSFSKSIQEILQFFYKHGSIPFSSLQFHPSVPLEHYKSQFILLPESICKELYRAIPKNRIATDIENCLRFSRGSSFRELFQIQKGLWKQIANAVVFPNSAEELDKLITIAKKHKISLICVGSSSTNMGGIVPKNFSKSKYSLAVSLENISSIMEWNEHYREVKVEMGMKVSDFLQILEERGYSILQLLGADGNRTLGGVVATGVPSISQNIQAITVHTELGRIEINSGNSKTLGSQTNFLPLLIGSEGRMGVFSSVTFRIQKKSKKYIHKILALGSYQKSIAVLEEIAAKNGISFYNKIYDEYSSQFLFLKDQILRNKLFTNWNQWKCKAKEMLESNSLLELVYPMELEPMFKSFFQKEKTVTLYKSKSPFAKPILDPEWTNLQNYFLDFQIYSEVFSCTIPSSILEGVRDDLVSEFNSKFPGAQVFTDCSVLDAFHSISHFRIVHPDFSGTLEEIRKIEKSVEDIFFLHKLEFVSLGEFGKPLSQKQNRSFPLGVLQKIYRELDPSQIFHSQKDFP